MDATARAVEPNLGPYWALIIVALAACLWLAIELRRAGRERSRLAAELAGAQAEAAFGRQAAVERDAAVAEARALAARIAAVEAGAEARAAAAAEREQALLGFKAEVEKSFGALAVEALARNEQRFLALANETFEKHKAAAAGGVKEVVSPVQEAFAKLAESVGALDKARLQDRSALSEQMRHIGEALKETQGLTGKLVNALRAAPKTRGRWGEETLRNVLELAGLTAHVDFIEQDSVETEAGRLRPDLLIRLPGERMIVVDSKVALSAYLDAVDAVDEPSREALLVKHAQELRAHVRALGGKEYWKHVPDTADFVALFVPGENFFAAAAERDPELFEYAIRQKVIITTPATMVALAKAVAYGWRQEAAAQSAKEIAELGRELYRRLSLMGDRLTTLGGSLEHSVKSYNELVGTVETRILPQARRFRDLGAGEGAGELARVEPTQAAVRLPATQGELAIQPPAPVEQGPTDAPPRSRVRK